MTARWRGHSHEALYLMINNGPGARASDPQTTYWQSLSDELSQVDATLNQALSNLNASWEGPASESASTGMTPLQAWAGDAQTGSSVMRVSSEDQAQFIASARAEMPKPVPVTTPAPSSWDVVGAGAMAAIGNPGPAAVVALQAADHERQEAAQSAAADKAVDTMNTYQSNSTWNRNTLGTFQAPPDVVVSTPAPAGSGTAGGQVGGWMTGSSYNPPSRTTTSSSFTTTTTGGSGGSGGRTPPPAPPGAGSGSGTGAGSGSGTGTGTVPSGGTTTPSTAVPAPPADPAPPRPGPGPFPPGPPGGGGNGPTTGGGNAHVNPFLPGQFPADLADDGGNPGKGPNFRGPNPPGLSGLGQEPGRIPGGSAGPEGRLPGGAGGAGGPGGLGGDAARSGTPIGRPGASGGPGLP
ncbi:MAG: PPE domain-containing protein, partial [Labedaea sp.]